MLHPKMRDLWLRCLAAGLILVVPVCELTKSGAAEREESLAELLPRSQPVEPEAALKTFRLARGFELELVAAEPLVSDPVDACFDADGRMFVAEMHGYPFSQEPTQLNPKGGGKKDAGIIRLLEDADGDGTFERSIVYADKLSWPTSVCCYNGGVFVLAPPHIYYLKDTDGDDRADVRRIVYTGFSRSNVQALANNMKWGLDHRIYLAGGRNGGELTHDGEKLGTLRNQDIRFDPSTEELEFVSGGSQFGRSMDDWGNWFVCSNSNHIQHIVFSNEYLRRNPYLAVSSVLRSIAKEGGASQVFRLSPPEPWRILRQIRRARDAGYKLVQSADGSWKFEPLGDEKPKKAPPEYPIGYFTSATGVTIYRGDAYPKEYRGNVFVGDVGGNLIHRKTLKLNGASFIAERADEGTEIVRSTDGWFRPVNFVNAPDGSLFILDMYRETIEHPHSIPEDIKAHLDLESGDDRGRIYRLVSPRMKRHQPPKLAKATTAELVAALDTENGWQRMTAHRLLWERRDKSAGEALEKLFRSSKLPAARMHALTTLDGLDLLTPEMLIAGLRDPDDRVREHAVRLSEDHAEASTKLVDELVALCEDKSYRVRLQLAYSLGEVAGMKAFSGLGMLGLQTSNDRDLQTALLSSVSEKMADLAAAALATGAMNDSDESLPFVLELARIAGSHKDPQEAIQFLKVIIIPFGYPTERLFEKVVKSLAEGLVRRGSSFSELLSHPDVPGTVRKNYRSIFKVVAQTAGSQEEEVAVRQQRVELLAYADYELAGPVLSNLLTPQTPQMLQLAAVEALAVHTNQQVGEELISHWRGYSPAVRQAVVDAMLARKDRTEKLLAAVQEKHIQPAEIERDKKQLLLNHVDGKLRSLAQEVLGEAAESDRAKIVAEHQSVLKLDGDVARGREVFVKTCSVCHRLGDVGHQVGPEFRSVQNKSPADLLVAILDPNREAQPNFTAYTVVTRQGKILNGIIAAETANSLTLRRAEGKQDVVLRSEIEQLVSSGKSIMPEGLEKDLNPQQLADVIAFVQTILPAKSE